MKNSDQFPFRFFLEDGYAKAEALDLRYDAFAWWIWNDIGRNSENIGDVLAAIRRVRSGHGVEELDGNMDVLTLRATGATVQGLLADDPNPVVARDFPPSPEMNLDQFEKFMLAWKEFCECCSLD